MSPHCAAARLALARVDDERPMSVRLERHVSTCLRCRAEAVRFRNLRRDLRTLGTRYFEAPAGLLRAVMAAITAPSPAPRRRPAAWVVEGVAAGAAVTVAVTAAVVGWRRVRAI